MRFRIVAVFIICICFCLPSFAQDTPAKKSFPVEKLSLTSYYYWYQGDSRKPVPTGYVKNPDGSSQFSATPLEGIGPWFSTLRTQWHKDQLADIRKAGIDIILPVYRGDSSSRKAWSVQGLDCLVQALKELNADQKELPQVGMFFDTAAMEMQYGSKKPDLRQDEVKQTFYGMIRDFYLRIPPEFRAEVSLPAERGGGAANIIFLHSAGFFSDWDAGFMDYCNQRFEKDFGAELIWLGSPDFKSKAASLDGYLESGAGLSMRWDGDGWLKVGAVGAGYDDTAVEGRKHQIRPRLLGETYRKDWDALLAKDPNWVLLDAWNQWHEGSQIAPDRLSSYQMVDFSRLYITQFNGMNVVDAKLIDYNIPSTMLPKTIYQVDLVIRNAGKVPWKPSDNVSVSYRWFKDGKPLDDGGIRVPLTRMVVAGGTTRARLGISTTNAAGEPLPEGAYELRVDLHQAAIGWFEDHGDTPVKVNVQIGKPSEIKATFLSSALPVLLKTGRNYSTTVKVRNDGSSPWTKAGGFELSYKWRKVGSYLHGASQETDEIVEVDGARSALPMDIEPGRIVEIPVTVKVSDHLGQALTVWKPEEMWVYQIEWELVRGKERLGESSGFRREVVEILPDDYGVCFLGSNVQKAMATDSHISVNVGIRNNGSETWGMLKYRLSYHWYYMDGVECIWDGEKTMLPRDIAPGESVVIHDVKVKAPPTGGPHILVFDLMDGDRWCSTTGPVKGGDILRTPVYIQAQNYPFFDLSKQYNTSACTWDTDREGGDFDGQGNSFAAECLPPEINARDLTPDAYPCGYLSAVTGEAHMSSRRVSFRWPAKGGGKLNAVSCTGQQMGMAPDRFVAFHLLGAATAPDAAGDFVILYSDGSSLRLPVTMTMWTEKPKHGEHVAATSLHRHGKDGDQPDVPCYLFHYTLQTDRSLPIVGITFPNNPAMKLVALTGQTVVTVPEPRVNPVIKKLEDSLKKGTEKP